MLQKCDWKLQIMLLQRMLISKYSRYYEGISKIRKFEKKITPYKILKKQIITFLKIKYFQKLKITNSLKQNKNSKKKN